VNAEVAVLGASGFIGRNLASHFAEQGWKVYAFRRPGSIPIEFTNHDIRQGELDPDTLDALSVLVESSDSGKLTVINCIGYGVHPSDRDFDKMLDVNVVFPGKLARLLSRSGSILVHLGSSSEYAAIADQRKPIAETALPEAGRLYGTSKYSGGVMARLAVGEKGRVSVLRLFNIFGQGEGAHRLFPTLIKAALEKSKVSISSGTQVRDFLYVKDVARAIELEVKRLLTYDATEVCVYNLCSGSGMSVLEFSKRVLAAAGGNEAQLEIGGIAMRPDDLSFVVGDNTKFCRANQWSAQFDVEAAVQDYLSE